MCQQMNKIKNIILSFFFLWNQILVCLLQFQNKLTVYTQHITLLPYIWYINTARKTKYLSLTMENEGFSIQFDR